MFEAVIQWHNELPHGIKILISYIPYLLTIYVLILFFKFVLHWIKRILTSEFTIKMLGGEVFAVPEAQQISTGHTALATTITEIGAVSIPPHIPQYWNDTTAHPWRRFGARFLDSILSACITIVLFCAVALAVAWLAITFFEVELESIESLIRQISSIDLDTIQVKIIDILLTTIVSVMLNAVQIGLVGSSIGKWLFGVKVLNNEYKPMGFKLAFKRELMVLIRGAGLNMPIISVIAEFISYKELRENGLTTWDRDLHCIVLHKYMSFWQVILCIVGSIVVLGGFTFVLGGYYLIGGFYSMGGYSIFY